MDLKVALPCVDGADPTFFGKLVFVDDGCHQWKQQLDGPDGSNHCR